VGEDYIVLLYDYVHLQKGVRNNLLDKDLFLDKGAKLSERESQCCSAAGAATGLGLVGRTII